MIARDGFAIELRGYQRVIIECIFDPHIAGVAVVAAEENVTHFRFRFHDFCQRKESDAAPATIEFAPSSDAVEIGDVFELREGVEFFPGEGFRVLDQTTDFKVPMSQRDFRFDPKIENGKALGEMLARRETVLGPRNAGLEIRLSGSDFGDHLAGPTFLALD